jgi:hypothetical protein
MSYISKNTGAFVNARLTDKGRELLSVGLLNFATYRLGDSEVDYSTLGPSYNIALQNVLKAKSCQPNLKTPLLPTSTAVTPDVSINQLDPILLTTIVEAPEKGFFDYVSTATTIEYSAFTTTDYVLEPNLVIPITGMNGTNIVSLIQGPNYVSGYTEPSIGDLVVVKMSNPQLSLPQDNWAVDVDVPVPYLWYKVQSLSGTASANTLTITVDRDLPDFSSSLSSNQAQTIFYPDSNLLFDSGLYSGGSVWNMNNVWTYNMPGVNPVTYEGFELYGSESFVGSKEYYGYTSELQQTTEFDPTQPTTGDTTDTGFCNYVNSISIIHYSNRETCSNRPELVYGEKFYIDTTIGESPVLKMPTLMWHRGLFSGSSTGDIIGYNFIASGSTKAVTLNGGVTQIKYYDLVDQNLPSVTVGRIFPDLQTITIDDQELVAALSYKSNRNWTLPTLEYGLTTNTNGFFSQTEDVYVTYMLESTSGYTTGLPCQNILCVKYSDGEPCDPDSSKKNIDITFPTGQFPYMNLTGGTGWYADTFKLLVQKVPLGTNPTSSNWVEIDYTSSITGHVAGTRIDPLNLENTTFTITQNLYTNSGTTFNLHDYINIPENGETDILQFGDEKFFYGNLEASGLIRKYRTQFDFVIPPNQFNFSQNPTYPGSGQNVHISELGIYDSNGNLVAIGKFITPIEKTNVTTIILEIALDF